MALKKDENALMRGNEIVVYQPNEVLRLDVRLEDETVWLSQLQMAELFGVKLNTVNYHIKEILKSGELTADATIRKIRIVQKEGQREVARPVDFNNLDMIISVGYRVNSKRGVQFRQWAAGVLKEYLLRGYAVHARMDRLEDKVDRRLSKTERDVVELREKVDYFVQTQTPPVQGVFYDGQLWDACSIVEKLIARAKVSVLLIDNWVGTGTLDMLAKKRKNVAVTIVTSEHKDRRGNPHPTLASTDIAKFNAQYPTLAVRYNETFHDRFLIIDDKELYLIGASLKDLGKKCFAFTKLDAGEITGFKARV